MTSNNQVSPVIRISRGERDASARATHLEAATRKFLVTTNERKQMSTKTNFKRIALVAAASLGLSLFSSIPANATIGTSVAVTTVAGTATTATSDSSTAATARVEFFQSTANNGITDSVTVSTAIKSTPTGASMTNVAIYTLLADTGTAGRSAKVDTNTAVSADGRSRPSGTSSAAGLAGGYANIPDPAGNTTFIQMALDTSASNWSSANYKVYLDTTGGGTLTAGTYTISLITTVFDNGVATANVKTTDVSIVVSALASASLTTSSSNSTAVLSSGTSDGGSTITGYEARAYIGTRLVTTCTTTRLTCNLVVSGDQTNSLASLQTAY